MGIFSFIFKKKKINNIEETKNADAYKDWKNRNK